MGRSSNITVAVRVRPLSQKEVARGAHQCLEVYDGCRIDVEDPDEKMGGLDYLRMDKHKDRSYAFDHAFDPRISQSEAFESTTNDLLPDVMNGRNACCFAYGATGSGKTFTMTGSQDMPGIIPHTVDALFEAAGGGGDNCIVTMQYVEIYNEQIKDLLQPSNGNLDVREAPGRGTFVAGAANVEVTSRDEVEELVESASRPLLRHHRIRPAGGSRGPGRSQVEDLLEAGNAYRTTESTKLNAVSSRSHAVLQLRVDTGGRQQGKLSLIDLAGSERANKTGVVAKGQQASKRLNEGANINRSLLALANCINALAKGGGGGGHVHCAGARTPPPPPPPPAVTPASAATSAARNVGVPYRDSKLTRLLKDSLGGGCRTMMIANVSPASDQFDETLNTLKYADRAKQIKIKDAAPRSRHTVAGSGTRAAGSGAAAARAERQRLAERAERSAAEQSQASRAAQDRHLQRMNDGRKRSDEQRAGGLGQIPEKHATDSRGSTERGRPGRAAGGGGGGGGGRGRGRAGGGTFGVNAGGRQRAYEDAVDAEEDEAAETIQRLARGRLARLESKRLVAASDILGDRRGRNPNQRQRAQISVDAGDAPAEFVPSAPRRDRSDRGADARGGGGGGGARRGPPGGQQAAPRGLPPRGLPPAGADRRSRGERDYPQREYESPGGGSERRARGAPRDFDRSLGRSVGSSSY